MSKLAANRPRLHDNDQRQLCKLTICRKSDKGLQLDSMDAWLVHSWLGTCKGTRFDICCGRPPGLACHLQTFVTAPICSDDQEIQLKGYVDLARASTHLPRPVRSVKCRAQVNTADYGSNPVQKFAWSNVDTCCLKEARMYPICGPLRVDATLQVDELVTSRADLYICCAISFPRQLGSGRLTGW